MAIEKFFLANEIQEGRRIVNLKQALRVVRLIPRDQGDASGLGCGKFLGSVAQRAFAVDGLRDGGGQVMRFKLSERSGENLLRPAERAQELSGHAGAQAGREGERQPAEISVEVIQSGRSVRVRWRTCQVSTSRRCCEAWAREVRIRARMAPNGGTVRRERWMIGAAGLFIVGGSARVFVAAAQQPVASASASPSMWSVMTSGVDTNLRGLSVVAPVAGRTGAAVVVWASGSNGVILKSVDSGKNWERVTVPGAEELDFRGVRAFSTASAYVMSSGEGDKSRIYKTDDGGATWKMQFTDTRPTFFLDAIACDGELKCAALSDPVDGKLLIVRTTDGENWQIAPGDAMPVALKDEGAFAASNSSLRLLRGAGRQHDMAQLVFATGGVSGARVFFSPDFGKSWTVTDTPMAGGNASSGIFSVLRTGVTVVLVGGDYKKPESAEKTAAYSTDGGKSYMLAATGPSGYRSGVAIAGARRLVAVGPGGSDLSDDGGRTWKRADATALNGVESVAGGRGREVWAVGPKGTVVRMTPSGK
jgi:photosystem II stability/assembly factor-like uncharacterized protein